MSDTYKSIYQPGTINNKSLVFAYPFLIDKKLDNYSKLLRNFFSVQFINHIKEASIINITTSAVGANNTQYNVNSTKLNPAETLARSLNHLNSDNTVQQYNYNSIDKREYQDKIYQFQNFILNQIKTDPRYIELNPVVSSVSVENLVDVPIILGSKQYPIESNVLFWILFLATGSIDSLSARSIELNNENSIGELKKLVRGINAKTYNEYFNSDKARPNFLSNEKYGNVLSGFEDSFDKGLKSLGYALNSSNLSDELSINIDNTFSVSINKILNDNPQLKANVINNSSALFAGLYSNDVVPLLQSTIHFLVGSDEIDYNAKLSQLTTNLSIKSRELFSIISDSIETAYVDKNENQLDQLFSIQEKMCEINGKIAVTSILDRLKTSYFSLQGTKVDYLRFIENLNTASNQMVAYTDMLIDHISQMNVVDPTRISALISSIKKDISSLLDDFYTQILPNRNSVSNRLLGILNVLPGSVNQREVLNNIISSLTTVIQFLSLYIYFSYNCEYLEQIRAKVQVSKNNAIQFPNYCLVLNAEIVYKIYMAMAISNLKNKSAGGIDNSFKITEQAVINMVRTLSQRLRIPNIIVIDEKSKRIYYRWMFHRNNSVMSMNIGNIESYINAQQNLLTSV